MIWMDNHSHQIHHLSTFFIKKILKGGEFFKILKGGEFNKITQNTHKQTNLKPLLTTSRDQNKHSQTLYTPKHYLTKQINNLSHG